MVTFAERKIENLQIELFACQSTALCLNLLKEDIEGTRQTTCAVVSQQQIKQPLINYTFLKAQNPA